MDFFETGVVIFVVILCTLLSLYPEWFLPGTPVEPVKKNPVVLPRDSFFGVDAPTERITWLVGTHGKILRSKSDESGWSFQKNPSNINLQDISAWNPETAVVVGDSNTILRTRNAGQSWRRIEDHPVVDRFGKIIRVRTYGDSVAYAVGQVGMVMRSNDAGKSWHRIHPEARATWNDVAQSDTETVVVVGEFGQISVGTLSDAGRDTPSVSWEDVSTPVDLSLKAVAFRTPKAGIAVGLNGIVLRTRDGGQSWTKLKTNISDHLWDVNWNDDTSRWYATGNAGYFGSWRPSETELTFKRLSESEFDFHTEAVTSGEGYVLTGANAGRLKNGEWRLFPHWRQRAQINEKEPWSFSDLWKF